MNISSGMPELAPGGDVTFDMTPFGDVDNPDVGIGNPTSIGQLVSHFVFYGKDTYVDEVRTTVEDLFVNAGSSSYSGYTIEDQYPFPKATKPRIDCPDNGLTDFWSYVIGAVQPPFTYIMSGVQAPGAFSGVAHYILNDGSLSDGGGSPLHDISHYESVLDPVPVVAFDDDRRYVYYAWDYNDSSAMWNNTYIGYRMSVAGVVDNSDYWLLEVNPNSSSLYTPAIALSGQNDASPNLYMVFNQDDLTTTPPTGYISYKYIDWGAPGGSFRPGSTGIKSLDLSNSLTVYPNPVTNSFTIQIPQYALNGQVSVGISDLTGNIIFKWTGNVGDLNSKIDASSWASGLYFVTVGTDNFNQTTRIIKR